MSLKSYFPKSQKCELAQRADRNHPDLQPETNYCLPGSRFSMIMRLARAGASDELFKKKVPGITLDTIRVARKIADGTISTGAASLTSQRTKTDVAGQKDKIFRMFEDGYSNVEIQVELGLAETSVRFYRRQWTTEKRSREAESCAG